MGSIHSTGVQLSVNEEKTNTHALLTEVKQVRSSGLCMYCTVCKVSTSGSAAHILYMLQSDERVMYVLTFICALEWPVPTHGDDK